jgi:hypothetical protein
MFVDDKPRNYIKDKALECLCFPHKWPGPRVIDNITTSCYPYVENFIHAPPILLHLGNLITDGNPRFHVTINGLGHL